MLPLTEAKNHRLVCDIFSFLYNTSLSAVIKMLDLLVF